MVTGQIVLEAFVAFWNVEKYQAYDMFCHDKQLKKDKFHKAFDNSKFTERLPLLHEIKKAPYTKAIFVKA